MKAPVTRQSVTRQTGETKTFAPIPADSYPMRCFAVVNAGTHEKTFKNESKKVKLLYLLFEIPEHKREDGSPSIIARDFTFSMSEKSNLRKAINQWTGKTLSDDEAENFDFDTLVGQPIMGTITLSKDEKWSNLTSIVKLPKSMSISTQHYPSIVFDIDQPVVAMFEKLPKWLQEKIKTSEEWEILKSGNDEQDNDDAPMDDLPF